MHQHNKKKNHTDTLANNRFTIVAVGVIIKALTQGGLPRTLSSLRQVGKTVADVHIFRDQGGAHRLSTELKKPVHFCGLEHTINPHH